MNTAHTPERPLVGVIRRHPLAAWLVWFFTVGQALAFVPVVAREVYDVDLPAQPFVVASTLVGLLLPTLAITRIVDGPDGLRAFRRRIFAVRVPLRWYALAIVGVPLATLAVTVAIFGLPSGADPSTIATAVGSGLLLQGVLVFASNNLWEEAAWTGFVQTRLQRRHGPLRAAVLTAPLFTLQHVSLVVGGDLLPALLMMTAFLLVAIPFRALVGWAYNVTGSLFLVGLIHAAGNAMTGGSGFLGQGMLRQLYTDNFVGVMHQLASALLGLAVIAATRRRLGARDRRTPGADRAPAEAAPVPASPR